MPKTSTCTIMTTIQTLPAGRAGRGWRPARRRPTGSRCGRARRPRRHRQEIPQLEAEKDEAEQQSHGEPARAGGRGSGRISCQRRHAEGEAAGEQHGGLERALLMSKSRWAADRPPSPRSSSRRSRTAGRRDRVAHQEDPEAEDDLLGGLWVSGSVLPRLRPGCLSCCSLMRPALRQAAIGRGDLVVARDDRRACDRAEPSLLGPPHLARPE